MTEARADPGADNNAEETIEAMPKPWPTLTSETCWEFDRKWIYLWQCVC